MTLLEKVKDGIASEKDFLSWADLYNRTPPYNIEKYWHEVAERYAQELTKAKLTEVRYKINDSPRDTIDMPGCKIAVRIIDKTIKEL